MSSQALAVPDEHAPTPAQATISEKKRRIPKRIVQAIELLSTGECTTQKAAAIRVGVTPEWLSKALKKDNVRVFIERRARETIAHGLMRASARLNELVDAKSEHVSFEAAKHIASIAGIKPSPDTQVSVNVDVRAGWIIDLSEPAERVPLVIDSEKSVK